MRFCSSVNLPDTGDGEHGPIYLAIERALWALGPALILLIVLGYPSQEAARQQITADQAIEIAAENEIEEVIAALRKAGGKVVSVQPIKQSLEELFL